MVNMTWDKVKEPVTGAAGAGTGLFLGELLGEFAARVTGQTSWAKAGVKTVVKAILGAAAFMIGGSATGQWSLFAKVFAYSDWGSILLDWIYAAYPGGVFGMAERAAVTARTWAVGTQRVTATLSSIQGVNKVTATRYNGQSAIEITPPNPTGAIGKYQ